jgi:hypothetical protein
VNAQLVDLDGSVFENVEIEGGDFGGASMRGTRWIDSKACGATFFPIDWRNADRSGLSVREDCDDVELKTGYRQFRAVGEHTCWSTRSVGHKCTNFGVSYTDCQAAFYALKAEDCCPRTEFGGGSVDFKLTSCTNFF